MTTTTLELTDRQIAILLHALGDAEEATYSDLIKRDRKELTALIKVAMNQVEA